MLSINTSEKGRGRIKFFFIPVVALMVLICAELLVFHLVICSVGGWQKESVSAATVMKEDGHVDGVQVPNGQARVFENPRNGSDVLRWDNLTIEGLTPANNLKLVVLNHEGVSIRNEMVNLSAGDVRSVLVPRRGGNVIVSCNEGEVACRW